LNKKNECRPKKKNYAEKPKVKYAAKLVANEAMGVEGEKKMKLSISSNTLQQVHRPRFYARSRDIPE